eukprot:361788-Chlamydomonas_euryale.AAC.4
MPPSSPVLLVCLPAVGIMMRSHLSNRRSPWPALSPLWPSLNVTAEHAASTSPTMTCKTRAALVARGASVRRGVAVTPERVKRHGRALECERRCRALLNMKRRCGAVSRTRDACRQQTADRAQLVPPTVPNSSLPPRAAWASRCMQHGPPNVPNSALPLCPTRPSRCAQLGPPAAPNSALPPRAAWVSRCVQHGPPTVPNSALPLCPTRPSHCAQLGPPAAPNTALPLRPTRPSHRVQHLPPTACSASA